jgi:hypothetical protein
MNFFVQDELILQVRDALECDKSTAMKEILRQTRRLYTMYSQKPMRHAKYWSKVDNAALFAIAKNRQLPHDILNVAINDLEKAEKAVSILDPKSMQIYYDFVYFMEKLSKPVRNKQELIDRLHAFVEVYDDSQIECLKRFCLTNSGNAELDVSLRDAIRRVRSVIPDKAKKDAHKNRIELAVRIMSELIEQRKENVVEEKIDSESKDSQKKE